MRTTKELLSDIADIEDIEETVKRERKYRYYIVTQLLIDEYSRKEVLISNLYKSLQSLIEEHGYPAATRCLVKFTKVKYAARAAEFIGDINGLESGAVTGDSVFCELNDVLFRRVNIFNRTLSIRVRINKSAYLLLRKYLQAFADIESITHCGPIGIPEEYLPQCDNQLNEAFNSNKNLVRLIVDACVTRSNLPSPSSNAANIVAFTESGNTLEIFINGSKVTKATSAANRALFSLALQNLDNVNTVTFDADYSRTVNPKRATNTFLNAMNALKRLISELTWRTRLGKIYSVSGLSFPVANVSPARIRRELQKLKAT